MRNRALKFEGAMIRPRRQVELRHREPHQTQAFLLQLVELLDLPHVHIGIAHDLRTVVDELPGLDIARCPYTSANRHRSFL